MPGRRAGRGGAVPGISLIGSDLHGADLPKVHGDLIGLGKVSLVDANLNLADLSGYAVGLDDAADLTGV